MKAPADCWNDMARYKNAENMVCSLEVVNMIALFVQYSKLVSEFRDYFVRTREQNFLFQAVENLRGRFSSSAKDG